MRGFDNMNFRTVCILTLSVLAFSHGFPNKQKSVPKSQLATRGEVSMYNGKNSTIEGHPYLVSILYGDDKTFECTGTILSDNWLITSRDCIQSFDIAKLTVVAGSKDGFTGDSFNVTKVMYHPEYTHKTSALDYEYALLEISGMFQWGDKIRAIKLPTSEAADYTRGMVSGWSLSGDDDSTRILQQGGMRWFPKNVCKESFTDEGYVWTDRMACLYSYSLTTLCDYDWGDPFTHKGVLYGVFVTGYPTGPCAVDAGPVLVADIFPVASWIQLITGASYAETL